MNRIFSISIVTALSAILAGCGAQIRTSHVEDYMSVDSPIQKSEHFFPLRAIPSDVDSKGALIESELIQYISNDLEHKGYVISKSLDSSTFCVLIQWQSTTVTTPGRNETISVPQFESNSATTTGNMNGAPVDLTTTSSRISTKDMQIYIPPRIYHPETYSLTMISTAALKERKIVERYRAESKYTSNASNPLTWAPEHLQKILETFQQSDRNVTGYLGIALNTQSSQPQIYEIDEFGPSANHYELNGSKLIEINGEPIRFRTQVQTAIKNSNPGSIIKLTYINSDGERKSTELKAGKIPEQYQINTPFF